MLKRINIKRKSMIFIIVALVFVVGCIYIFNKNRPYRIEDKYSFSEINSTGFEFTMDEKANINEVLEQRKIEDAIYFGLAGESTELIDMYVASGTVKLCGLLDNYEYQYLKKEFQFLSMVDIKNMNILNLVYYIEISNELGIEVDYELINDVLYKFYDSESKLFFVDGIDDSVHTKIIVTALCKNAMGDKISTKLFQLEDGIRTVCENYEFKTKLGESFYNSGADIVYCYSVFDMMDELNYEKISGWYDFWKAEYEKMTIQSFMDALWYSEYLNIAKIFEQEYSEKKLYDYYNNINENEISEINDLSVIYNVLKNIKVLDNDNFNTVLKSKISKEINKNGLYELKIDIKSTAIGVLIAQQTDFELDNEKLKKYVADTYVSIEQNDDIHTKIEDLYYNLILDQLINGYVREYNTDWIQNQINTVLDEISYEDNLVTDIIATRRIVEIVTDLQMFDADVQLTNSQVKRIKKGVETAYKNEAFESSLICELYLLDNILSLDVVDIDRFYEIYADLKVGNGVKSIADSEVAPDLMTTYQFHICFERMGDEDNFSDGKAFAESMMVEDGIYRMSDLSEKEGTIETIFYGNALNNVIVGENYDRNKEY